MNMLSALDGAPILVVALVACSVEVRRWVRFMDARTERKADRRNERELARRQHFCLEEGPRTGTAA